MDIVWIWFTVSAIGLVLIVLSFGFRRANMTRRDIPEEGIEDIEVVLAYDRISQWPQFRLLRIMIINELKKHSPKGVLVDAGCGPGYLTAKIARLFPDLAIIGVDISEEMEKKAKKNFALSGLVGRVSFRRGDIQELPFDDNSLDFVVSSLSLHHWSEPRKAINEIDRVLKPRGQLLIFDLRRDVWRIVYWVLRFVQLLILPSPMKHNNEPTNSFLSSCTPAELDALMSSSLLNEWKVKPGIFWTFIWGQKA